MVFKDPHTRRNAPDPDPNPGPATKAGEAARRNAPDAAKIAAAHHAGAGADAIRINRPKAWTLPLVVASPHSGSQYPQELIARSPLPLNRLRSSEDCFVDEIFAAAPALGAPLLEALFPRVLVDVNREAWELDPAMFSEALPDYVTRRNARISAGLGTIARVVSNGEPIYADKLPFAEAQRRVRTYYEPYHRALAGLIAEACARFGHCILIDCHSMPSGATTRSGPARRGIQSTAHSGAQAGVQAGAQAGTQGGVRFGAGGGSDSRNRSIDIVLGDRHATACDPLVTATAERVLGEAGYLVRRNSPYAGGFVTCNYGRPREDVHALQIEINRTLYMDEDRLERRARIRDVTRDMTGLIAALGGLDLGQFDLGRLDLAAAAKAEAAE